MQEKQRKRRTAHDIRTPRPEIEWFAEEMEQRLRTNDHKNGWTTCYDKFLLRRLRSKIRGLGLAVRAKHVHAAAVIKEAVDVANYAMMVADRAARQERDDEIPF